MDMVLYEIIIKSVIKHSIGFNQLLQKNSLR